MLSIKDTIRAADDIARELCDVKAWGVKVEVRSMSGKARARLLRAAARPDGTMDFEALYPAVLIACCFDPESGDPVFTAADAAWLNDKSAGPVEMLAQLGMKLSGLGRDTVEEEQATFPGTP